MSCLSLHGDGLNDDSLRHVVGYLDGVDLSRLECVCLEAKEIAESYGWDIVARQDVKSPCQLESSSSLSLKNRVVRWTLTSRYAAKIESRHEEQLKRDEAIPGPTLSQGVKASKLGQTTLTMLPNIFTVASMTISCDFRTVKRVYGKDLFPWFFMDEG
jgi:hypothetical protein